MLKTYYHATPYENLESIMSKGLMRGCDGVIYLTEKPEEAARFVAIRGYHKILVIGIDVEEDSVEESFDHSQVFFNCRAYTYSEDIEPDKLIYLYKYTLN